MAARCPICTLELEDANAVRRHTLVAHGVSTGPAGERVVARCPGPPERTGLAPGPVEQRRLSDTGTAHSGAARPPRSARPRPNRRRRRSAPGAAAPVRRHRPRRHLSGSRSPPSSPRHPWPRHPAWPRRRGPSPPPRRPKPTRPGAPSPPPHPPTRSRRPRPPRCPPGGSPSRCPRRPNRPDPAGARPGRCPARPIPSSTGHRTPSRPTPRRTSPPGPPPRRSPPRQRRSRPRRKPPDQPGTGQRRSPPRPLLRNLCGSLLPPRPPRPDRRGSLLPLRRSRPGPRGSLLPPRRSRPGPRGSLLPLRRSRRGPRGRRRQGTFLRDGPPPAGAGVGIRAPASSDRSGLAAAHGGEPHAPQAPQACARRRGCGRGRARVDCRRGCPGRDQRQVGQEGDGLRTDHDRRDGDDGRAGADRQPVGGRSHSRRPRR